MSELIVRHLAPTLIVDATRDAGNALRSMWAWHARRLELLMHQCYTRRVPWVNWDEGVLREFFPTLEIPQ